MSKHNEQDQGAVHRQDYQDLVAFLRSMLEISNRMATDFRDISLSDVSRPFPQDSRGVRIEFTVSRHILGKMPSGEGHEALKRLVRHHE